MIPHCRLSFFQDPVRDADGGGEAGGVLVDVEIPVEVGNPHPFRADLLVHVDSPAVVMPVEVQIGLRQGFLGQGLARFRHLVALFLKGGEHGLTEDRRAEGFQQAVEQVAQHGLVPAVLAAQIGA